MTDLGGGPRRVLVVAHQGGWDEMALLVAPLVVIGVLLWLANRRATRAAAERDDERGR